MTTQADIIAMLKKGDKQKRICLTLHVSPKTVVKARKVYQAELALRNRRESERVSLFNTIPTNGTKQPPVKRASKSRESLGITKGITRVSIPFIYIDPFKLWLKALDRSKYQDSSLSAIKRLVDHKRAAFVEGYVALVNEYLEGMK